jgi:hypothetical protein
MLDLSKRSLPVENAQRTAGLVCRSCGKALWVEGFCLECDVRRDYQIPRPSQLRPTQSRDGGSSSRPNAEGAQQLTLQLPGISQLGEAQSLTGAENGRPSDPDRAPERGSRWFVWLVTAAATMGSVIALVVAWLSA